MDLGTPPNALNASTWQRRKLSSVWSKVNRAYTAGDHESTITKHERARSACPTRILPKWPQSTCACSPGHRGEAQERLRARPRPHRADVPAQLDDRAGVAAVARHLEQPRRAQPRVLLQRLSDESLVRVEHRRPDEGIRPDKPVSLDGPANRVVVDAKLGGDGADTPVLGEVEAADP